VYLVVVATLPLPPECDRDSASNLMSSVLFAFSHFVLIDSVHAFVPYVQRFMVHACLVCKNVKWTNVINHQRGNQTHPKESVKSLSRKWMRHCNWQVNVCVTVLLSTACTRAYEYCHHEWSNGVTLSVIFSVHPGESI
jgi:hypothetical protein